MIKFKKPQFIAIGLAVFVFVLLLLLPRVQKPEPKLDEPAHDHVSEIETPVDVSQEEEVVLQQILAQIEQAEAPLDKITWMDSLSSFWERKGAYNKAAKALYDIADIIQDKPSYLIAGDKYFKAFQDEDNADREQSLRNAIKAYERILEINPQDLEVMTSLAVCYIEGSQLLGEAPMKGIGMLKSVLQIDPKNVNALINLGYFSSKSGQYELAIQRFEQVLEIDPEYLDAYLYLSDIYLSSGNKEKAITYLETYKSKMSDPEIIRQLEVYIEKINSNNI